MIMNKITRFLAVSEAEFLRRTEFRSNTRKADRKAAFVQLDLFGGTQHQIKGSASEKWKGKRGAK